DEEKRIKDFRDKSMALFPSIYKLVAEMFRGLPGLYDRLSAAYDRMGPVSVHESNDAGNWNDQWDSRNISALSNAPNGRRECIKMTAADRLTLKDNPVIDMAGVDKSPRESKKTTIIYDRYLWHRMDTFQRVLLQLHEEFYFLGSDVDALALGQKIAEPTR